MRPKNARRGLCRPSQAEREVRVFAPTLSRLIAIDFLIGLKHPRRAAKSSGTMMTHLSCSCDNDAILETSPDWLRPLLNFCVAFLVHSFIR